MSTNLKVVLLAFILVTITAVVSYFYLTTDSSVLVREARELFREGDIYAAHDKAEQAMRLDPTNRAAISLKAELFFEVQSDTNFKDAQREYNAAQIAIRNQDYTAASEHFYRALDYIDNISIRAQQYEEAKSLEREITRQEAEVTMKISEQYYNNALRLYRSGELSRAYEHLRQAPAETLPIQQLKSDIAYSLGVKRYDEITANPSRYAETYYNDAYYWLGQVSSRSDNYEEARKLIQSLTDIQQSEK